MVGGLGHAIALHILQDARRVRQVLLCYLETSHGGGLGLSRVVFEALRFTELSFVHLDLVFQGLLQELEVVPGVGLLPPRLFQLGHRLLLQVLEYVEDAPAAGLVRLGCGRAQIGFERVVALTVAALHKADELLLVMEGQCRSVDNGTQHLHQFVNVGAVQLRLEQRRAVQLPLQNVDGALKGVDGVSHLCLDCGELLDLLIPDLCGRLKVALVHRDRSCEVLDLGGLGGDVGVRLVDGSGEILDIALRRLDLELLVLGAVLAPIHVGFECFLL
mmetsp:Transcript_42807/g.89167  ORF Transcript_42807/g.89167 Transcript_42807/m.89167 type:complete len:274 (+) Transcript_42807:1251-2072(+)